MIYFYGCKYRDYETRRTTLEDYSPLFDNEADSHLWYKNFGVKLEKMFNRKLIASKRKYR